MERMLAAVFEGAGKLYLKEVPVPKIQEDSDVMLEVEAAGICGTDIKILEVPPIHPAAHGVILSHEYAGRILATGKKVKEFEVGERVVVNPNIPCQACIYCKMGLPNLCERITTLGIFIDGGFARYNVAPAKILHPISSDLPAEKAVFTEPLSCVMNATKKLNFQPGESVVVLGAGPIGLLFTQVLRASGAGKIIVSEVSGYRQEFLEESGATHTVNPLKENLKKIVKEVTKVGADVVVDTVGTLFKEGLTLVRRGGKIVLFGQNYSAKDEIFQNDITRKEISVLGSFIAQYTFPLAIKIIEGGNLKLNGLITHRLSLKRLPEGIKAMKKGEAIKVIITP